MIQNINLSEINWLSVIVVTIISLPLGAFWHSPILFGKAWQEDAKPEFDSSKKSNFFKLFGFTILMHFIAIIGLDLLIGSSGCTVSGIYVGLFAAILFVSTTMGVSYAFAGRPLRLLLIDAGFYLFYFVIAGAILGAW